MSENQENQSALGDEQISAIDEQINAARSRKQTRGEEGGDAPAPRRPGRRRLSDEERAARDAARAEEKARKKAEREAARARKKAEKEANQKPAHMLKVEKAAAALPELNDRVRATLQAFTSNEDLNLTDIETLVAHLNHFVRTERTRLALESNVKVGQAVTITGGDPRFIGASGTVEKVQRIRCYVAVEGQDKPVYLFTSDVAPLSGGEGLESASEDDENQAQSA